MIENIKQFAKSWIEWRDAKAWAKALHPNWVRFATQRKRPELRETYRKMILDGYHNRYC